MSFVHLHNHTEYSLLDGAISVKKLISTAKELGMPAVAITDHGYMYGIVDAYLAGLETGIKVLIGCEVYVAPRSHKDKDSKAGDREPSHLVLLAQNDIGYKNLIKLVSVACVDGFYYRPRVDRELLQRYSEGLIALSACIAGEIPRLLLAKDYQAAKSLAITYNDIFRGRFYLEVQRHGLIEEKIVNSGLIQISRETGIRLAATNDVHYLRRADAKYHDIMLCIQTGKRIDDNDRLKFPNSEFYFKTPEEMQALFTDIPEALENTLGIADQCNVELNLSEYHLPEFPVPKGYTAAQYLRMLCESNIGYRYGSKTKAVMDRLNYELETIEKMGFSSYFLVVWDFVKYAKDNGIAVGPGRGSAAGSMVSYLLNITDLDPLKHGLFFERFLNIERVSMPDIDIDFDDVRRTEVIDYVTKRYGQDHVAQITTFGTLKARSATRDVSRVLNMPLAKTDRIAKLIPYMTKSLKNLLQSEQASPEVEELRRAYQTDNEVKEVLDAAMFVEGFPRHASIHAAGVVITKDPVSEYVPLARSKDDVGIVTQFPMGILEKLGLLKMDFLGLSNLNVIKDSIALISHTGEQLNLAEIPDDDKKAMQIFNTGNTIGIFQFESAGMRQMLQEFRPTKFEDLVLLNAAYRPGPMAMIPEIVDVKHGKTQPKYLDPRMEPILSQTYGSIVYQEQVMQLVQALAGFTLGRADLLRRAMGKKQKAIMDKERENFLKGCSERQIDETIANAIYDMIAKFAEYGFPKPHSAAYSLIAYHTAYLKAHYPLEFMSAKLTSEKANPGKVAFYINECHRMGLKVLPPDINIAGINFEPIDNIIYFGLSAIKNIGYSTAQDIVSARKKGGRFKSLTDLCLRAGLNKRELESLIKAGACSCFGNRAQLLAVMDLVLKVSGSDKKRKTESTLDMLAHQMFPEASPILKDVALPEIQDIPHKDSLELEREYLGLYLSGHPLDNYTMYLEANNVISSHDMPSIPSGQKISIAGVITGLKRITTKKGAQMAFATLTDQVGSIEVIIFPKVYQAAEQILRQDTVLLVKGKNDTVVTEDDDTGEIQAEPKLIADTVEIPQANESGPLIISISDSQNTELLGNLLSLLKANRGKTPVYLRLGRSSSILVAEDCWVNPTDELKHCVEALVGRNNCSWPIEN